MHKALSGAGSPGLSGQGERGTSVLSLQDWGCDYVIALVSRQKNVPIRLLTHRSRCRQQTAKARQLAMYLSHVILGRSLAEVGEAFGRDRTTVSHACAAIEDLRDNPAVEAEIAALERAIEDELAKQEAAHAGH